MVRRIVGVIAGLLLAAATAVPLSAQGGTIRGTVSDSAGTGLANAAVSVEGTTLRSTSGSGGAYEIRGVPAGPRTVRVRLIGYRSATEPCTSTAIAWCQQASASRSWCWRASSTPCR